MDGTAHTINHKTSHSTQQSGLPNAISTHKTVVTAFMQTESSARQKLLPIDRDVHTFQVNVPVSTWT